MASNAKKKTTMAKLNRENAVRERRLRKQARKDARKHAAENPVVVPHEQHAGELDDDAAAAPSADSTVEEAAGSGSPTR
jgi:hypothetical protein